MSETQIDIKIESTGAQNTLRVIASLDDKVEKLLRDSLALGRTMAGAFTAAGKSTDTLRTNATEHNKQLDTTSKYLRLIWGYYKVMAGFRLIDIGVNALEKYADTWVNINNQMKAALTEGTNIAATNRQIFQLSQQTRTSYAAMANLYTKMSLANDNLRLGSEDVLKLTKAISQSFVLSGSSAGEAASSTLQIGQALSKGIVNGDELRSILENNAVLGKMLAQHLGKSRGELVEMGAQGKITARVLADAMLKNTDKLNADFAKMGMTIGQAREKLENAALYMAGFKLQTSGASKAVVELLEKITKGLEAGKFDYVLTTFGYIVRALSTVLEYTGEIAAGWLAMKGTLYAARAGMMGIAVQTALAGKEMKVLDASAKAAKLSIRAAMGSTVVGLIGVAIGVAAERLLKYQMEQEATEESTKQLIDQLGGLNDKFIATKDSTEAATEALKAMSMAEMLTTRNKMTAGLEDYENKIKSLQVAINNLNTTGLPGFGNVTKSLSAEYDIWKLVDGYSALSLEARDAFGAIVNSGKSAIEIHKELVDWVAKLSKTDLANGLFGGKASAADLVSVQSELSGSIVTLYENYLKASNGFKLTNASINETVNELVKSTSKLSFINNPFVGISDAINTAFAGAKKDAEQFGKDVAEGFVEGFKKNLLDSGEYNTATKEALVRMSEIQATLKGKYSKLGTEQLAGGDTTSVASEISQLTNEYKALSFQLEAISKHSQRLRDAYAEVLTSGDAVKGMTEEQIQTLAQSKVAQEEAVEALKALGAGYTDLDGKYVNNRQRVMESTAAVTALTAEHSKLGSVLQGLNTYTRESITLAEKKAAVEEQIKALQESTAGRVVSDEEITTMRNLTAATQEYQHQLNMLDASDFGSNLKKNLNSLEEEAAGWKIKMTDAVSEIGSGMVTSFLKGEDAMESLKNSLGNLSEYFIQLAMKMLVYKAMFGAFGGSAAGTGTASSGLFGSLFGFHSGGVVGNDSPTFVRKYHTGGIIGSDEVPAILQKGEGVFTKGQMEAMGGSGSNVQVDIRFDPALKGQISVTQETIQQNNTTKQIVLSVIKDNKSTVNSILGTQTRSQ